MQKYGDSLIKALSIGGREHLALVGGGGKTTLMFALAEGLRHRGDRVVTSTTTKVLQKEARIAPEIIFIKSDSSWKTSLKDDLDRYGHVFLAGLLLESGKVTGIDSLTADEVFKMEYVDHLILEADGSAGHPVKVPDDHEPVIPQSVTKVAGLMGLEAIDRDLEPEIVFRTTLFEKVTGLKQGQKIEPSPLSKIFTDPKGIFKGTPCSAKRIVFLNKLDLISTKQRAEELASLILQNSDSEIDLVVIGSVAERRYLPLSKQNI